MFSFSKPGSRRSIYLLMSYFWAAVFCYIPAEISCPFLMVSIIMKNEIISGIILFSSIEGMSQYSHNIWQVISHSFQNVAGVWRIETCILSPFSGMFVRMRIFKHPSIWSKYKDWWHSIIHVWYSAVGILMRKWQYPEYLNIQNVLAGCKPTAKQ